MDEKPVLRPQHHFRAGTATSHQQRLHVQVDRFRVARRLTRNSICLPEAQAGSVELNSRELVQGNNSASSAYNSLTFLHLSEAASSLKRNMPPCSNGAEDDLMADEAEPAALAIGHFDTIDLALLEPVVAGLEQSGILVRVVAEPSPGRGSMGPLALMATAVVLKVSEILVRKILEETGKDAYAALRRGFAVIWERLHRVRDPGYSNTYSMKLSLTVERSGKTLKLLLPPTATPEDAERAFTMFMSFCSTSIADRRQEHPIGLRESASQEVWVFSATTNRIIAIDPDSDD